MTADKTVTVSFFQLIPTTFTLTTEVTGGHGSISDGGTYDVGTQVTVTATPENGYQVASWSGTDNDASTANTNTVTMTADKTVIVTFEEIPPTIYTLTAVVVGGHGSVDGGGDYEEDTVVTLTAAPETGYRVASWSGTDNDAATATTNTVTMTATKVVTVTFEEIPATMYTLTVNVSGSHGSVTPTTGVYEEDTIVTLTATPDDEYQVASWDGTNDDGSTANTNTVTMTEDKTVTVTFGQTGSVPEWQDIAISRLMAIRGAGTNGDMMIVQGTMALQFTGEGGVLTNCLSAALGSGASVKIQVGPLPSVSIPTVHTFIVIADSTTARTRMRQAGSMYIYTGGEGGISLLTINTSSGAFMMMIRGVDLTGLASPVPISFDIDTYRARTDYVSSDIPLAFLAGTTDLLRAKPVKPVLVQAGGKVLIMMLRGDMLVRDRTGFSLADATMTVNFGNSFSETISGFRQLGTTMVMYTRPFGSTAAISNAMFNTQTNSFSITLQNATIAADDLAGDVDLTLEFGPTEDPFSETATYTID